MLRGCSTPGKGPPARLSGRGCQAPISRAFDAAWIPHPSHACRLESVLQALVDHDAQAFEALPVNMRADARRLAACLVLAVLTASNTVG